MNVVLCFLMMIVIPPQADGSDWLVVLMESTYNLLNKHKVQWQLLWSIRFRVSACRENWKKSGNMIRSGEVEEKCKNSWKVGSYENENFFTFSTVLSSYGVMRCWHGYLSGAKCKWYAYGSADSTPSSPTSAKSRMVYPSGTCVRRLSWKKRPVNVCVCVCHYSS